MKILDKSQFNALSKCLQYMLLAERRRCSIKNSRCKELLAIMQGFNTANGLLCSLPLDFDLSNESVNRLVTELQSKHQFKLVNQNDFIVKLAKHFELCAVNNHKFVTPFFSDYSALSDNLNSPLLFNDLEDLKIGVPCITFLLEERFIYPNVIQDLGGLEMLKSSKKHGINPTFLISTKPTMNELKEVLASKEVSELFLVIEGGFSVTTDKKLGMRFGQLNEDAKLAKDTLQNYFTDKFGQPAVEIRL